MYFYDFDTVGLIPKSIFLFTLCFRPVFLISEGFVLSKIIKSYFNVNSCNILE